MLLYQLMSVTLYVQIFDVYVVLNRGEVCLEIWPMHGDQRQTNEKKKKHCVCQ